jgi:hypothetical protein
VIFDWTDVSQIFLLVLLAGFSATVGYFAHDRLRVYRHSDVTDQQPPFGKQLSTSLEPISVTLIDGIEALMVQAKELFPADPPLEQEPYELVAKLLEAIEGNLESPGVREGDAVRESLRKLANILEILMRRQAEVRGLRDALIESNDTIRRLEQTNARLSASLVQSAAVPAVEETQRQRDVSPEGADVKATEERDLLVLCAVLAASLGGNGPLAAREFEALRRAAADSTPAALIKALFENERSGLRWIFRRTDAAGGNWSLQWTNLDQSRRQLSDVVGRYGFKLIWPDVNEAFDDLRHRVVVDERAHRHAHGRVQLLVRPGVENPGEGYIWPAMVET